MRVLVLGATSAVAAEVIRLHARRGDRLHLVARNPEKLAALAASIDGNSKNLTHAIADLDRLEENERVVRESIAALGGLDQVLLAHGLLGEQLATERSYQEAAPILQTNLLSAISLIIPIANHFETARAGRLGVITSVAGDRGRPRNYTYGAAKGALNLYLQGLRSRLHRSGVSITAIKLGPVDTPMTASHEKTAVFSTPAVVAKEILRAIDRGASEVYVPRFWALIMYVVRHTPEWLFQKLSFLSGR